MTQKKHEPKQNVSDEVLASWKAARRQGDVARLITYLDTSFPNISHHTVQNALNNGFVKLNGLSEKISQYFAKRIEKENKAAGKLNS